MADHRLRGPTIERRPLSAPGSDEILRFFDSYFTYFSRQHTQLL